MIKSLKKLILRTGSNQYFNWSHSDVFYLILKSKVRQKKQ